MRNSENLEARSDNSVTGTAAPPDFFIISYDTISNELTQPTACKLVAVRKFDGREGWLLNVEPPYNYGDEKKPQLLVFQKWAENPLEMLRMTDEMVGLYVHCAKSGIELDRVCDLKDTIFCDWAYAVRDLEIAKAKGWVIA